MDYFARDAKGFIAPKALDNPDSFFSCVVFTLATIQQAFYAVPMILQRIEKEGIDSPFLFASKREGFAYASENRAILQSKARAYVKREISLDMLILEFMEIPGLGLAKASFLAQMVVGDGACLDRHNLRALGLPESFTKASKDLKPASLLRRVEFYNSTWRKHGDSAFWWNTWCDHVATMYPKKFANGAAVSALHRLAV